ncbi:hypothetical protein [Mucilaginibacter sp. UYCu711]|uniref:hypothetical protein n=1 Tax=Mucilaginibacter sp. UYCu711 TaxID=3156339 RepID=UPI003D247FBD
MKKHYLATFVACTLLFTQACKKSSTDTTPTPTGPSTYALSVTGGTYPSQTTYMFGTLGFPSGTLGTTSASESASTALVFRYGKNMYQSNFGAPATLHKFEFDAAGKSKEVGSLAVAGLKTIAAVDFISDTEAWATVAGYGLVGKLVKFNPSTMTITSTIDLSSIQKTGSTEVYYEGLIHRDNYLYMCVNYQNKSGSNLEDKVFVTIIDRTTGTVFKQISDSRSSEAWNSGTESSFQPNVMVKDASGDIYVMGYANNGKPSGILRIKSGTTDFDTSYFFDLSATTGKPCIGILYFGAGQVFTVRYGDAVAYPFDLDANYNSVATCQYYKIDLAAKTTSGNISTAIPNFFGNSAFAVKFDDSKIYFNCAGAAASSNAIYSYQISNGAVVKEFGFASGACNAFAKLN